MCHTPIFVLLYLKIIVNLLRVFKNWQQYERQKEIYFSEIKYKYNWICSYVLLYVITVKVTINEERTLILHYS